MQISGNTVFIPGATSGIGLELALALQAKGNTVIVGGRRIELLDQIRRDHPGVSTVRIDISDPASIDIAAQQVLTDHPTLNILVTMAGIMRVEDWHHPESFLQSAEEIVTTNVLGPIRLIAAFIEHLQVRPEATIITVSSGLAFAPLKVTPSYNASKAAIHMLSESLRLQLADTRVEVKELLPPAVRNEPDARTTRERIRDAPEGFHRRSDRAARERARCPRDPGRTGEVPALWRGPRRLRRRRGHTQRIGPTRAPVAGCRRPHLATR